MRVIALLVTAIAICGVGFASAFRVPSESEALILRGETIQRQVGPGLRLRIPLFETVRIEPVRLERNHTIAQMFDVQTCKATISTPYTIGDLAAYHRADGDLSALDALAQRIEERIATLPDLASLNASATSYGKQISARMADLAGPLAGGLNVVRIGVRLAEGCEPKRVIRRETVAGIDAVRNVELGEDRATAGFVRAVTADGAEVEVRGFVATYGVLDRARAAQCFGNRDDVISTRVGHLAERAIVTIISELPLARIQEVQAQLSSPGLDGVEEMEACGLSLGGIDFATTEVAILSVIDCAVDQAEECLTPQAFTLPDTGSVLLRQVD